MPTKFNLQAGLIVNYVLTKGKGRGKARPAMITNAWPSDDGRVNLTVFSDLANDDGAETHAASAPYSDANGTAPGSLLPGTWNFIDQSGAANIGPSDPPDPGSSPAPTVPRPVAQD